jgi:type IV pilus assembly protein PilA
VKKEGFTLVELLAVIAILAILIVIALPGILKMFNNAKKDIFVTEARSIVRSSEMHYFNNMSDYGGSKTYNLNDIDDIPEIKINKNYSGIVTIKSTGKVELCVSNGDYYLHVLDNQVNFIDSLEEYVPEKLASYILENATQEEDKLYYNSTRNIHIYKTDESGAYTALNTFNIDAQPNNYIKIGNNTYRISSIDSSNRIKIIADNINTSNTIKFDIAGRRTIANGNSYCADTLNGCNIYKANGTTVIMDSFLYEKLHEHYDNLNSDFKSLLVTGPFYAGLSNNISNPIIQDYIGIMDIKEYLFSSSRTVDGQTYTQSDTFVKNWVSTYEFQYLLNGVASYDDVVLRIEPAGNFYMVASTASHPVRPMYYLNPDITYEGGTGNYYDPYIITLN